MSGSIPDLVEAATDKTCPVCHGEGWVCENHPDRPWDGLSASPDACGCGAGQPCKCTGMDGPQ